MTRHIMRRGVIAIVTALVPISLAAQAPSPTPPPTMEACYVPASGTIYRINTALSPAAGAPGACLNVTHVRFGWNQQGPAGALGATGPQGAKGDVGPAGTVPRNEWDALRLDGANGFVSQGITGPHTPIGNKAQGTVLLWYPDSAAFRAGYATTEWAEANLGRYSAAIGYRTLASGIGSVAFGQRTSATGKSSSAFGERSLATGFYSTAMGLESEAAGLVSTAIGLRTIATGNYSFALGANADATFNGSFVFGDFSPRSTHIAPDQANQFLARTTGGVVFQVSSDGRTGCYLAGNSGGWQCTSDRNQKTGFHAVDGEKLLGSLRDLPITTWRYRSDTTHTTHLGPTAQDFRAAFSLGRDSVTIGSVDAQGVAIAAAKALEARTRALTSEIAELRAELKALKLTLLETRRVASVRRANP